MRVAIIGGGFTGLTAAYELLKQGHDVTIFERDKTLGGLAIGWKENNWDWYLEKAYHHLFTNDDAIIGLIKELGIADKLIIKRPITANLLPSVMETSAGSLDKFEPCAEGAEASAEDRRTREFEQATSARLLSKKFLSSRTKESNIFPFDSPLHLLRFPRLSVLDKMRTASLAAFCKINPFWQPLEGTTAKDLATTIGGQRAWELIWEPLMVGKFGAYADKIAASWLWARIHKRTPNLCYIAGGFQTLVNRLSTAIKDNGGKIYTDTEVPSITVKKSKDIASFSILHSSFDKILLTVPTPIASKLIGTISTADSQLSTVNSQLSTSIPHLHAQVLILETEKPILQDVYWLNILDRSFPFLAAVAHTNFMDKKHYGGHHLTYFGNYLPSGHNYLSMTKQQLLKEFLPFIKRILPTVHSPLSIINSYQFTAPFAQPVHERHYSTRAPKLETGIPHIYLANMDSIYPWDRGTNYAVELGQKAAHHILASSV